VRRTRGGGDKGALRRGGPDLTAEQTADGEGRDLCPSGWRELPSELDSRHRVRTIGGPSVSSLLDLTGHGDVATITDESKLPQVKLMSPLQLYRLWERQNWVSHEIDLSQDRADWEALSEEERDEMLWGLSAFFVGEERVTNQFSGLVLAAEDKNEEAFLITQQVDEARHAQHFNRLYEEVFHYDGSFEDRLAQARRDLTPDYFKLFDGYLVESHEALLENPSDIGAKVDFVTIYHMVIEGTLALTGQYFQTDNLENMGILPGHLKA